MAHVPVMMEEVLKFLDPKPNQNFVDCTLGDGGHAFVVLERIAPNGKVLGIDADAEAIVSVESGIRNHELGKLLIAVQGNFRNLASIVASTGLSHSRSGLSPVSFGPVQGILLDLGFSSSTLMRGRGFSFEKDEILDMRFDASHGIRAAEIINGWNQKQLQELLEEYAEEKFAREIANLIVERRKQQPIVTTKQLADVVVDAYREKLTRKRHPERSEGSRGREILRSAQNDRDSRRMPWIGGIHPATKTFQSLRIEVNDELGSLQAVLPQAIEILQEGGRLAVIAFHSLEDRIVKNFFRECSAVKILTKKPVVPSDEEIAKNFRARSAKLRVVEKM